MKKDLFYFSEEDYCYAVVREEEFPAAGVYGNRVSVV